MVAPGCIAAARTGFLLAALHSVAERVNPRKARPPAPHRPRVLASAQVPIDRCWEKSREVRGAQLEPEPRVLRSIPLEGYAAMARPTGTKLRIVAAEACGVVFGPTGT